MNNFHKWAKEFDSQNLYAFNHNPNGLLWLKVRAICRGKLLKQFVTSNNIELTSTKIAEQNIELFEELEKTPNAMQVLDIFLNDREHEWYQSAGIDENKLKSDLYKVHHYAWGGNQNNSLDKHLVSRYVRLSTTMMSWFASNPKLQRTHGIMYRQAGIIIGHHIL